MLSKWTARLSDKQASDTNAESVKSITLLAPNFYPETNAAAKRLTGLAEYLADFHWQVTVITPLPHHPQNQIFDGYENVKVEQVSENGVSIVRLKPLIVKRSNFLARLVAELYFVLKAVPHVLRSNPAIIFTSIPYMFLAPAGLVASRLKRSKYALDVRDLTWQYPKAAGKQTFGADRLMAALMKYCVRNANLFSATTVAQVRYFPNKPKNRLTMPNGVSEQDLAELIAIPERKLDGARPVILYAGLFGYNQNLSTILSAAAELPDMTFILVGDGPDRERLLAEIRDQHLRNVTIKPFMPFRQLIHEYEKADILVSHVRNNPIFKYMQSAKVWEYMATGKPIIHGGVGDSVNMLNENQLGIGITPDDPKMLVEALLKLTGDPECAANFGRNSRAYVQANFRRSQIFAQYELALNRLIQR